MMGNKKLSEIRLELQRRLAASGLDLAWFDQQIAKLDQRPMPRARAIETLRILQKLAAQAVRKKGHASRMRGNMN